MPSVLFCSGRCISDKECRWACEKARKDMKSNGPSFDTEAGGLRGGTALFPDIDVARDNGSTFLCIKSSNGHGEDIANDGVEDLVGIPS